MEVIQKDMQEQKSKGDLMVNNLIYQQPKALSLAVNRTLKKQYFQKSTYTPLETAVCDFNSGSDYISIDDSYLLLDITSVGGDANFGAGSILNCIERIVVTSRSGTELDRLERANIYNKQMMRFGHSQDWISGSGSKMGMGTNGLDSDGTVLTDGVSRRHIIPLKYLCGFFRPINGQLIPPSLAAGMRIEITFADYRNALFQKSGTVTNYLVDKVEFSTDCVTLADDTQKSLNTEASKTGLEYTYERFYTSSSTVLSTAVNLQIRKAVSMAKKVHTFLIPQANLNDVTTDSQASAALDIDSWGYRLGGLHFPNQPIRDDIQHLQTYQIAESTWERNGDHRPAGVGWSLFQAKNGELSASLERDTKLNVSGLPLNNSRVLELDSKLNSYSVPLEAVSFLQYICVCRSFLDNTVCAI
jgi:hypothetical protein